MSRDFLLEFGTNGERPSFFEGLEVGAQDSDGDRPWSGRVSFRIGLALAEIDGDQVDNLVEALRAWRASR